MTQKAVWWVVGAVVVIGGILLLSRGSNEQVTTGNGNEAPMESSSVAAAFGGSGSIKCDYNDASSGASGSVYVKNGKVRIQGEVGDGTVNVIQGGDKVYSWGSSNGQTFGVIMSASTVDARTGTQQLATNAELQSQLSNPGAHCAPYAAPDSLFVPPTDVQFTDVTMMGAGMMPAGAGPSAY